MPKTPKQTGRGIEPADREPSDTANPPASDGGASEAGRRPVEPDPSEIVDEHRTDRHVEDMADEID